mgnify:CR=1 FL=1
MIYTSYFAKLNKLPNNIVPISICGKAPDWYTGLQYKKLALKYDFFIQWKQTHDDNYYIEHFKSEVLDKLNINDVLQELYMFSHGHDIALICFEKPTDFCHRHLVADWITENTNEEVKEYEV